MLRTLRAFVLTALLLLLAAPWSVALAHAQTATPEAAIPAPVEVRVMTFNFWVGGGVQVDLAKVVEAIETAGADVVGLQEVEGHARQIAEALGWLYVDERMQIISRFPLIDPPGADGLYTLVEVRPGQVFAMANVHLPSDPYGPEAVRDGATPEEVLELEAEMRLPLLEPFLERLPELAADGIPTVITGDFNSPSHLEWTAEMAEARDQAPYPLAWPVGVAAGEAGFRDSFREAHPDPVQRPGLTWTPGYPHPTLRPGETLDRIDWVLVAGDIETLNSEVVGEDGNPAVDLAVTPWPSDHRGVVSTLRVTPGSPPILVAVNRRVVAPGEEIIVRYHAPGEDGDRVMLVLAGGDPGRDALMALPPQESFVAGAVVFGTGTLVPGAYEAVLTGADGGELARIPFRVQEATARPTLSVAEASVAAGEPITVRWEHAPGYKWDWIGIYAAGDPDLYNYLAFLYTKSRIDGSVVFDEAAIGGALEPAEYEARLMRDDGYVLLAMAPFTVTERGE